jgi:hypothetical protein
VRARFLSGRGFPRTPGEHKTAPKGTGSARNSAERRYREARGHRLGFHKLLEYECQVKRVKINASVQGSECKVCTGLHCLSSSGLPPSSRRLMLSGGIGAARSGGVLGCWLGLGSSTQSINVWGCSATSPIPDHESIGIVFATLRHCTASCEEPDVTPVRSMFLL